MSDTRPDPRWKGPTVAKIAELAGVGTASVDRVLNNRPGVKEKTRQKVMAAYEKLSLEKETGRTLDLRFFCESGETFIAAMEQAVDRVNRTLAGAHITSHCVPTSRMNPAQFARQVEQDCAEADGVLVIAREHPAVNRAMRKLVGKGAGVVCLTTDLPSSRRSAYIGNDQHAAGSVAAFLIGQILPKTPGKILIVMSEAFRAQQEREMGFRRVLRAEFPHLKIDERVVADDQPETVRKQLLAYFAEGNAPAAVYNTAGANRGVGMALTESGLVDRTIFVGHELTGHSRALLEAGVMDYVISHDYTQEVMQAAQWLVQFRQGVTVDPAFSQILVHTKYNCDL
ncbi:LacI family DNA-binding transcriptional regulator [Tropicibacter naphthalenivorans]|uniref:Trehalose repressor n=1 Tax=Tropicibacter naphthalenivorans TaxID=441103 RepID=A0A0P1GKG8_9RHOB|nr:LacI family DNA-binding transcriptional regulator [Tropicibacter naphthalenivorans]CUH82576.1 trehalose repressor [Tropicibacter naphthalenivorans]SMD09337.1 LacI family transcriptional regulator [Tropicibacter naphthalenivorans]